MEQQTQALSVTPATELVAEIDVQQARPEDTEEPWVTVTSRRHWCKWSENEFTLELTPAYEEGVKLLARIYGVDQESKCDIVANYIQPHVLRCDSMSLKQVLHRKEEAKIRKDELQQKPTARGFMNVCVEFLHSTLAIVNPPREMTHEEATSVIVNLDERLRRITNQYPLTIRFAKQVQEGTAAGGRKVWFIASDATLHQQDQIKSLRDSIDVAFSDLGWRVRFPRDNEGQIHTTIRDGRYEGRGIISPPIPKKKGPFDIVFDRLVVTPAAYNDPRHSFRRQYCGATHVVPFLANLPGGSSAECGALTIDEGIRHREKAQAAHPESDANTVAALTLGPIEDDDGADGDAFDRIFLLRFGTGDVDLFQQALQQNFESCIGALREAELPWELVPSRAKIFVHPHQYATVLEALGSRELRPFHVVIASSFEPLLEAAMASIPYKKRPRLRRAPMGREGIAINANNASANGSRFSILGDSAHDEVPDDGYGLIAHSASYGLQHENTTMSQSTYLMQNGIHFKSTFLCETRKLHDARSVVQSTTEAHSGHGINPRRVSG